MDDEPSGRTRRPLALMRQENPVLAATAPLRLKRSSDIEISSSSVLVFGGF
jgi:hypothetical protein